MRFQLSASCVNFRGAAPAAQQNGNGAGVTPAFKGQLPVHPHPPASPLLPSNNRWMSQFHYVPPPIDGRYKCSYSRSSSRRLDNKG